MRNNIANVFFWWTFQIWHGTVVHLSSNS